MTIPTDTTILIPTILIVLNEGLKRYFNMSSSYAIVINWIGGIALNLLLAYPIATPQDAILLAIGGFLMGSSAGGLYDGGKLVVNKIRG